MGAFIILKKRFFFWILRKISTELSKNCDVKFIFSNSQLYRTSFPQDIFRVTFEHVLAANFKKYGVLNWIMNNCFYSVHFRNFLRTNVHKYIYIYLLLKFYTCMYCIFNFPPACLTAERISLKIFLLFL